MALKTGDKLRVRTLGSGSIAVLKMFEGSGGSWQKGEPLIRDASGGMDMAATSNAVDVAGFAVTSGTAATDSGISSGRYIPWTSDILIEGCIAGASEATLALQSTHMHHGGFLKQATCGGGAWYVDLGSSTSSCTVRVVGFRDATGTVHARVLCRPTTIGIDVGLWKC